MNLEDIILSEISQIQKDNCYMISHVESKVVEFMRAEQTVVVGSWREGNMEVGQRIQILLYKSKFWASNVQHGDYG